MAGSSAARSVCAHQEAGRDAADHRRRNAHGGAEHKPALLGQHHRIALDGVLARAQQHVHGTARSRVARNGSANGVARRSRALQPARRQRLQLHARGHLHDARSLPQHAAHALRRSVAPAHHGRATVRGHAALRTPRRVSELQASRSGAGPCHSVGRQAGKQLQAGRYRLRGAHRHGVEARERRALLAGGVAEADHTGREQLHACAASALRTSALCATDRSCGRCRSIGTSSGSQLPQQSRPAAPVPCSGARAGGESPRGAAARAARVLSARVAVERHGRAVGQYTHDLGVRETRARHYLRAVAVSASQRGRVHTSRQISVRASGGICTASGQQKSVPLTSTPASRRNMSAVRQMRERRARQPAHHRGAGPRPRSS
jgi:hypothetical protein